MENVFLKFLDDYNINAVEASIRDAFDRLKIANKINHGMRVMLKVNIPYDVSPDLAETTHPSIVRAMSNVLLSLGASSVIVDSPYKSFSANYLEKVYLNTGMLDVENLTKCHLNDNLKTINKEYNQGKRAKSFRLLQEIENVDLIINIGKLKIDDKLGYIGAVSNLFGIVPGNFKEIILNRQDSLKDYYEYLVDLYEFLKKKIVLNVLDGIVAKEFGNSPRMLSCLAVSEDAYSLDASVCDILGIDYENTYLKQAQNRELFDFTRPYKSVGEDVVKFKVEDFMLWQFNQNTKLHKKSEQKRYNNSHQKKVVIEEKLCKGCSICSKVCPTNAITMKFDKDGELFAEIDYKKCIYCYKCKTACPYNVSKIKVPNGYKKIEKEIEKNNKI